MPNYRDFRFFYVKEFRFEAADRRDQAAGQE
jgi:hypothetical protein